MNTRITRVAALGLSGVLVFGLTACADDDPDTTVVEKEVATEESADTATEDTASEDTDS